MMNDTEGSTPLSLEDQCLLHLICHLEEYLPETLSSLPLHLRRRLLLNLPVFDICQLENTPVSASIDMESIWGTLVEHQGLWCDVDPQKGPKHQHMSGICEIIFNLEEGCKTYVPNAKEALFSAVDCLGIKQWGQLQHSFAPIVRKNGLFWHPTPYRHKRHFPNDFQQQYMLWCVVEKCQWMPLELRIHGPCFENSELWTGRSTGTAVMEKFLSRIEDLHLVATSGIVTEFILTQLFSNRRVKLTRLTLESIRDDTMASVAKYFSVTSKDPLYSPQPNIPYTGLSSIEIGVDYCSQELFDHLESVIFYQPSLTSMKVEGKGISVPCSIPSVASTLSSLFHRPQFRKLSVRNLEMTGEHFGVFIQQFLSVPPEDHEKILEFSDVSFLNIQVPKVGKVTNVLPTSSCPKVLPRKALIFCFKPLSEVPNFFQSLLACGYTTQLSSLTVMSLNHVETILPTISMLQHLHFTLVALQHLLSPDTFFANLFQSPHLKSVHLRSCAIGPGGLLPALTRGLQRQTFTASLEELNLVANNLAVASESELQAFFDVLFSLPQLSSLQVDLRDNCLNSCHLSIMIDSFRRIAGKTGRLKELKLWEKHTGMYYQNNFEDLQLHKMALEDVAFSVT